MFRTNFYNSTSEGEIAAIFVFLMIVGHLDLLSDIVYITELVKQTRRTYSGRKYLLFIEMFTCRKNASYHIAKTPSLLKTSQPTTI
jgi:hypothetical protein